MLLYVDLLTNLDEILSRAIGDGGELVDLLPDSYKAKWLQVLATLRRFLEGHDIREDERRHFEDTIEADIAHAMQRCGSGEDDTVPPSDEEAPSISHGDDNQPCGIEGATS